uniref:FZ domain-containing protein n=1 Tax=Arion vulgaris TaxID=1028688 RepID=A0A0B6XZF3_9EUPU
MFLNTTFGLFVLAVYGFRPVFGSSETCDERQNTMLIQRRCKHENEAIVIAEMNDNHVEICRQFPLLLKCAVTAIPHCYGFVETTYSMYSHSPFSCELTETLIKELQDIQRKGTHITKSKPERPDTTFPSNIVTQDEYFASSLAMSHRVTTAHQGNNGAHQEKNDKFESGDNSASTVVPTRLQTIFFVLVSTKLLLQVLLHQDQVYPLTRSLSL